MAVSQADLDTINAYMAALEEGDLPSLPGPSPSLNSITPAVVNKVVQLIQQDWGYWTPIRLRSLAKLPPYEKNFSREQMAAIRNAYRARYLELRPPS